MQILIVSATPFEVLPLQNYLSDHFRKKETGVYADGSLSVRLLISGVGLSATAFSLALALATKKYDLVINAGIAGAFNRKLELGQVVHVTAERFGDLGVEEANGDFRDLFELGLEEENHPPFQKGWMMNEKGKDFQFLENVRAISVNKVHGQAENIAAIQEKYHPDIESMEGAAFFYACLMMKTPFIQIRAISNYVEPRNKENWNIPLAIENLNKTIIEMLKSFPDKRA